MYQRESSSKRMSPDSKSPGTSHINKQQNKLKSLIPSIENSTDDDIGIGSGDDDDLNRTIVSKQNIKYQGSRPSEVQQGQKSLAKKTFHEDQLHTEDKPRPPLPRPGLVKRTAFHSDLPDEHEDTSTKTEYKEENKSETRSMNQSEARISSRREESITMAKDRGGKYDGQSSKIHSKKSDQKLNVEKDLTDKRKFGRSSRLEEDEDSDSDNDIINVHNQYRKQLKDSSAKRISGSRMEKDASRNILDDDSLINKQKNRLPKDNATSAAKRSHMSETTDFPKSRSHRQRGSSQDEVDEISPVHQVDKTPKTPRSGLVDDLFSTDYRRPRSGSDKSVHSNDGGSRSRSGSTKDNSGKPLTRSNKVDQPERPRSGSNKGNSERSRFSSNQEDNSRRPRSGSAKDESFERPRSGSGKEDLNRPRSGSDKIETSPRPRSGSGKDESSERPRSSAGKEYTKGSRSGSDKKENSQRSRSGSDKEESSGRPRSGSGKEETKWPRSGPDKEDNSRRPLSSAKKEAQSVRPRSGLHKEESTERPHYGSSKGEGMRSRPQSYKEDIQGSRPGHEEEDKRNKKSVGVRPRDDTHHTRKSETNLSGRKVSSFFENSESDDDSDYEVNASLRLSKPKEMENTDKLAANSRHGSSQLGHKRAGSLGSALTTDTRVEQEDARMRRYRSKSDFEENPWDDKKSRSNKEQEFSLRKSGSLGSLMYQKNSCKNEDTRNHMDSRTIKTKGGESVSVTDSRKKPSVKGHLGPDIFDKSRSRTQNISRKTCEVSDDESDSEMRQSAAKTFSPKEHRRLNKNLRNEGNNSLSKTGPLKANKDIAGATDKKSQTTAKRDHEKSYSKRSLSFTNISNISPKSPYLDEEDDRPRTHVVDSASLREQIYYDWLKKKDSHMKTKVIKKKQSEKEKEEEAEREKQDKKIMSQKAFEAWSADKDEKAKEKAHLIHERKKIEKDKLDETQQKKMDSKKYFESWKAKKDETLIESHRKRKEEEREKRQKELEEKEDKIDSAKKVYDNWKSKKDDLLRDKIKQKKMQEKEKRMTEYEKQEKKRNAEKAFENWKDKKPRSLKETGPALTQRAWCPSGRNSGNVVPQDVQPVIQRNPPNRSRTLSATARFSGSLRTTSTRS